MGQYQNKMVTLKNFYIGTYCDDCCLQSKRNCLNIKELMNLAWSYKTRCISIKL